MAESEDMNVGEVDGITLLGLPELELSSEIGPLVIYGKVVIDGKSRAVVVSVSINTQLFEGIGVGDNASLAIAEVVLRDRSDKRLAPCRITFSSVNQAQSR